MLTEREFVHTKVFDKQWKDMGCDEDDLAVLQKTIADNPQGPPVISGTGGIRKIRVTLADRGKSGGARVLYVDFVVKGIVGLLSAYPKSEKENIDESEKKILRAIVKEINKSLEGQK